MKKFTPGPWTIDRYNKDTVRINGLPTTINSVLDMEQAIANAQLIAAAPDMLEVLQWVLNEIETTKNLDLGLVRYKIKDVIRKATE